MSSRRLAAAPRPAGLLEPPLEALDPAAGVHQLLLPRVERVAVRADLDVQVGLGRARHEFVAARAAHGGDDVLGMNAGFHCSARIAAAVWGATLPPETTAATVLPSSSGTLPASSAAAVAAPASSQASFMRPYMNLNPSFRSASETSRFSTPRSRQMRTQFGPAYGPLSPSAADFGSMVTDSPAAMLAASAFDSSGSTANTRASGLSAFTAVAIPETSPPQPT